MNPKIMRSLVILLILAAILSTIWKPVRAQTPSPSGATALIGSNLTYQGRLQDAGDPVTGECDFRFQLFASAGGSDQVGATLERLVVPLQDGYFSLPDLDFGAGAFRGEARWLAVSVRCPAGTGTYETLTPRQALTAAPAALSLRLPFIAEANLGGPLAWFENDGDGEASGFSSAGSVALWVDHAGTDGIYVNSAGQNGLRVVSAGAQGLQIDSASGSGVYVAAATNAGLEVGSAGSDGLYVGTAGDDGVHVNQASGDGVYVYSAAGNGAVLGNAGADGVAVGAAGDDGFQVFLAGNPTDSVPSDAHNGFEVAGAQGSGLSVGRADLDGVYVSSAGYRGFAVGEAGTEGVYVGAAGDDGVYVGRTEGTGLYINSAKQAGIIVNSVDTDDPFTGGVGIEVNSTRYGVSIGNVIQDALFISDAGIGVHVWSADFDGVEVDYVGDDGVNVYRAGSPSTTISSDQHNGVEVDGAQGYGLFVGRADLDGVYVNSTAWHGLNVAGAGVDGLYVNSAGSDGIDVTGNAYAGNFHGNINVSGDCYGCVIAVFGINASDQALEPGQVVAIQDIQAAPLDNAPAIWSLVPAAEGLTAVGVVRGRAEMDIDPGGAEFREDELGQRLVPVEGAAQPGEYLSIVIYGPMQVKSNIADGAIQPGMRLAVDTMGAARVLKLVTVQGVQIAESAPLLGIALSSPDEHGLVWVLVNPQ